MYYWLATKRACGLVVTNTNGVVVGGCAYYSKFMRGKSLQSWINKFKQNKTFVGVGKI